MNQELRLEFKMAIASRRPSLKPMADPVANDERKRQDQASGKARNLALAHPIDGLVRSGEIADMASVANRRALVTAVTGLFAKARSESMEPVRPHLYRLIIASIISTLLAHASTSKYARVRHP